MSIKKTGYKLNFFVLKLYGIVSDPANEDIITWTAEGDGILIKDCD